MTMSPSTSYLDSPLTYWALQVRPSVQSMDEGDRATDLENWRATHDNEFYLIIFSLGSGELPGPGWDRLSVLQVDQ